VENESQKCQADGSSKLLLKKRVTVGNPISQGYKDMISLMDPTVNTVRGSPKKIPLTKRHSTLHNRRD
jgi:hypothetical protein